MLELILSFANVLEVSPPVQSMKTNSAMDREINGVLPKTWTCPPSLGPEHGTEKLRTVEAIASRLEAITTSSKKLLVTRCIATRSKDATRGSWHRY